MPWPTKGWLAAEAARTRKQYETLPDWLKAGSMKKEIRVTPSRKVKNLLEIRIGETIGFVLSHEQADELANKLLEVTCGIKQAQTEEAKP